MIRAGELTIPLGQALRQGSRHGVLDEINREGEGSGALFDASEIALAAE